MENSNSKRPGRVNWNNPVERLAYKREHQRMYRLFGSKAGLSSSLGVRIGDAWRAVTAKFLSHRYIT